MTKLGEVGEALLRAAEQADGTVRELCVRALVSYAVGRYTVSRMLDRGELVVVAHGRPSVIGAPRGAANSDGVRDAA